jgi:hypothetical protein
MTDTCPSVIQRLQSAWNAHDVPALLVCLHPDYESVHPLCPDRNLHDHAALARRWSALFEFIPDRIAELIGFAVIDEQVWTEWRWHGTHTSGPAYTAGGVMIFEIADDGNMIRRARVYTNAVEISGPDFDAVLDDILNNDLAC